MKINNKGYASTIIMFSVLTLFLVSMLMLVKTMNNSSSLNKKITEKVVDNINYDASGTVQNQILELKTTITSMQNQIDNIKREVINEIYPVGSIYMSTEGIDGKQEEITKKIYEGDKLTEEKIVGNTVTKASVNKIVEVGTGRHIINYNAEIGDDIYITPSFLAIRIEPNEKSEKLITLNKNTKVELIEKKKEWYKIQYQSYAGWAKAECFTSINPNELKQDEIEIVQSSKRKTDRECSETLHKDV